MASLPQKTSPRSHHRIGSLGPILPLFSLPSCSLHAGYHAALAWYNDEGVDQKVFHRVIDEQRELFTWVGSKMSEKLPPLEKLWDSIKVYAVAAWEYVATKVSEFDFASTKKGVMEGVRNATRNVQEYLDEHLD